VHVVGCSRKPVEISTIGYHVYQRRLYFRRAVLTNCDDVLHVESRVKSRCAYSCICAVPCFALHIRCLKLCRALHWSLKLPATELYCSCLSTLSSLLTVDVPYQVPNVPRVTYARTVAWILSRMRLLYVIAPLTPPPPTRDLIVSLKLLSVLSAFCNWKHPNSG